MIGRKKATNGQMNVRYSMLILSHCERRIQRKYIRFFDLLSNSNYQNDLQITIEMNNYKQQMELFESQLKTANDENASLNVAKCELINERDILQQKINEQQVQMIKKLLLELLFSLRLLNKSRRSSNHLRKMLQNRMKHSIFIKNLIHTIFIEKWQKLCISKRRW